MSKVKRGVDGSTTNKAKKGVDKTKGYMRKLKFEQNFAWFVIIKGEGYLSSCNSNAK